MKEADIVRMLRERDERGAECLLRQYGALIRYIIAPILPDVQDQEECISEVVMRAWEKIYLFDPARGSWNGWLTTLARNAALNRVRKNKPVENLEDISREVPSKEPMPEEEVLKQERKLALARALRELSAGDKALFYRKYYYLQSTAQIAAELGMTERAVEGKLYRIKKRLQKLLGGEVDE